MPESPLTVELATEGAAPALLDMMEDYNRGESIAWQRATAEGPLLALLLAPEYGAVGLLREGEALVGYFVLSWGYDLEWGGREAFLDELYLVPAARGRSLGRHALAAAEAVARAQDARALHLLVRHDNPAALALYRRAGYASPPRRFMTKAL